MIEHVTINFQQQHIRRRNGRMFAVLTAVAKPEVVLVEVPRVVYDAALIFAKIYSLE